MGMKFFAVVVIALVSGCALAPRIAPEGRDAEADCVDVWNRMHDLVAECSGRTDRWPTSQCSMVMMETRDVTAACVPALQAATCDTFATVWLTDCEDVFKFPN